MTKKKKLEKSLWSDDKINANDCQRMTTKYSEKNTQKNEKKTKKAETIAIAASMGICSELKAAC